MACDTGRYMSDPGSNASVCLSCPVGFMSADEGESSCQECQSSVDYQPEPGQASCVACPAHALSVNHHSSCECAIGYYSIPFGDYSLFAELDYDGYTRYMDTHVLSSDESDSDPATTDVDDQNEHLGFWCVPCPEGADCSQPGTSVDNVTVLDGYFLGVEGSGTVFLACLNDACEQGGSCSPGYTGSSCTECDGNDLVLGSEFQCEMCPQVWQMILGLLLGFLCFLAFLYYKMNSQKEGYQSLDVYVKIVVSAFQLNGLALSYAFDWDALMSYYLSSQNQISSLGTAYIKVECFSSGFSGQSYNDEHSSSSLSSSSTATSSESYGSSSDPVNIHPYFSSPFVTESIVYLFAPLFLSFLVFLCTLIYRVIKMWY